MYEFVYSYRFVFRKYITMMIFWRPVSGRCWPFPWNKFYTDQKSSYIPFFVRIWNTGWRIWWKIWVSFCSSQLLKV